MANEKAIELLEETIKATNVPEFQTTGETIARVNAQKVIELLLRQPTSGEVSSKDGQAEPGEMSKRLLELRDELFAQDHHIIEKAASHIDRLETAYQKAISYYKDLLNQGFISTMQLSSKLDIPYKEVQSWLKEDDELEPQALRVIDENRQLQAELKDVRDELSTPETMGLEKEPLYKWAAVINCAKLQAESKLTAAKEESEKLLNAVQMTYRKHHIGDENIGWEELSDLLCDTLCEVMTDKGYQEWLQALKGSDNGSSND